MRIYGSKISNVVIVEPCATYVKVAQLGFCIFVYCDDFWEEKSVKISSDKY